MGHQSSCASSPPRPWHRPTVTYASAFLFLSCKELETNGADDDTSAAAAWLSSSAALHQLDPSAAASTIGQGNTRRRHNPRNAMCAPFRAPVRRRGMRMRVVAARCGQPCGLAACPEPLACLARIRRNVSRYRISWPSTTNHATNHPSTPKVRRQGERSIRPPPSVVPRREAINQSNRS
uniref:Uncharacterized protein n=1 Tax=Zea mays TaxID=4577 RepID=C0P8R5_MAIZE|nr:unknown [Zea mays]|eukprot:XP_023155982.1 uncharacterized protein LOC111589356 [Zea mays]